jgi:hypothetical protein
MVKVGGNARYCQTRVSKRPWIGHFLLLFVIETIALARFDADQKGTSNIGTLGGPQPAADSNPRRRRRQRPLTGCVVSGKTSLQIWIDLGFSLTKTRHQLGHDPEKPRHGASVFRFVVRGMVAIAQ